MCPPPWLIPPHLPTAPQPHQPIPDVLHPAAAATLCCFCAHFSTVLLLLFPVSLYFFASLPRLFPFPMCHHGSTGLRGTRIPEALNHAACRGRIDSPFFFVWRRGAYRGRRETVFRVGRGGRNGRTVRAILISRRETSGTYEDEDRFRLIEQVFQPTHSQRKELCVKTLASFYKRHLMSCSFVLNEQLINIE